MRIISDRPSRLIRASASGMTWMPAVDPPEANARALSVRNSRRRSGSWISSLASRDAAGPGTASMSALALNCRRMVSGVSRSSTAACWAGSRYDRPWGTATFSMNALASTDGR